MSFPDNELLNGACYVLAFSVRKKVFFPLETRWLVSVIMRLCKSQSNKHQIKTGIHSPLLLS